MATSTDFLSVWGWGSNAHGQVGALGGGGTPAQIEGLGDVVMIAAGGRHSLALRPQVQTVPSAFKISTTIMGVGSIRRLSAVRWGVAGNIVLAWILTFPICGAIALVTTKLVR